VGLALNSATAQNEQDCKQVVIFDNIEKYSKNKEHVYVDNKVIKGADSTTFTTFQLLVNAIAEK
jgi:hypothetical protein